MSVEFRFRPSGDIPALQAEAERASFLAGYVDAHHIVLTDTEVWCVIAPLLDGKGIYLFLGTMG